MKLKWQVKNPGVFAIYSATADHKHYTICKHNKGGWAASLPHSGSSVYPDGGFSFREAKAYCQKSADGFNIHSINIELVIKCLKFHDGKYCRDSLKAQFSSKDNIDLKVKELLKDLGYKEADHRSVHIDRNHDIVIGEQHEYR